MVSSAPHAREIGDMLDNVTTEAELVLDARAAARFSGLASEPRVGMRCGHIAGTVSVPYTDLPCRALRWILERVGRSSRILPWIVTGYRPLFEVGAMRNLGSA